VKMLNISTNVSMHCSFVILIMYVFMHCSLFNLCTDHLALIVSEAHDRSHTVHGIFVLSNQFADDNASHPGPGVIYIKMILFS